MKFFKQPETQFMGLSVNDVRAFRILSAGTINHSRELSVPGGE